jgi:hypothetical protein
VDAMAKVAQALGMTLSSLYEGEGSEATKTISCVDLIGRAARAEATWSPLLGVHTVFLDDSGTPHDIRRNNEFIAIYEGESISVFEKVNPGTLTGLIDDSGFLILAKNGDKYLASIALAEAAFVTIILPGSELELDIADIEWIAKRTRVIPRSLG